MIEPTLAAAAFGDQPAHWPLPTARTPNQLWLRAVAAGGQGRYGSAYRDLAVLRRSAASGRLVAPLVSLAHSTQGSFLRQLGWHARARGWDGRALALAGADPEARGDALIGLAADALGVGRFAAAAALLARADSALAACAITGAVPDRLPVRRRWVGAELAMACGDGAVAVRRAEEAVELAQAMGQASERHRVKSEVVLAAALCSAGDHRARPRGGGGRAGRHRPLGTDTAAMGGGLLADRYPKRHIFGTKAGRNPGCLRRPGAARRWNLAFRLKRLAAVMVIARVSPRCVRFVTLEIPPSMTIQGERLDAVVAEAVAGDGNALREVLETIRPIVVRYCRARVGIVERGGLTADDVAQEVCLATLTALPRYRDRGRPFLAFLYGIAAHKVADAHRAAGRDLAYPSDSVPERWSSEAGPEQRALEADSVSRMNELLDILPAKQREILILRVVVGLSAEETAAAVGATPGAVRVAQHRALSRLKSEMVAAGDYA